MKPYHYLGLLLLPALVVIGYSIGGSWNLLTPFCCFILHPLTSLLKRPNRPKTVPSSATKTNPSHFRMVALCFMPVLVVLLIWSISKLARMQTCEWIWMALSVGIVNGVVGFTLAHEFIHRSQWPEKLSGRILLLINNYPHYELEHIGGHHVYACTPKDPHTAIMGESFYRFLPRAIWFTYLNSWEIERKKIKKQRRSFFSVKNRMLVFTFYHLLFYTLLFTLSGIKGVLFFSIQSFIAIALLYMADYIQHYGLFRQELHNGKLEKINVQHSWNSGNPQQEFNLFHLENHADHHLHPSHSYDELEHHSASPQLPGGYSAMTCLALIPPLWFRIIHKNILLTAKHQTS